jgi:hypothetical protein
MPDEIDEADRHRQAGVCVSPRTFDSVASKRAGEEAMKRPYLVRLDKDVTSDWGASVPDLPACVAWLA